MVGNAVKAGEIDTQETSLTTITTDDLKRLPTMTGWFEPTLLFKLLGRVIISDVFGQYADRRLMQAALDPATKEEHVGRARMEGITTDADGATWIDYVSDLGDGFDATYAIACLLAQPSLTVGGHRLHRGSVLVMGGDEVYPTALREDYKQKMRLPYDMAWPVTTEEAKTPLFLLPGNHDWYDGLVNFLAIFCREKPTKIGGWTTPQRRSYFAVQVAENWWIWGIDIALVRDMDQPQADYFVVIAKAMHQFDNIILCSAEPGWYKAEAKGDAYRTLSYVARIARDAKKDLKIPLILSGDSHHYARYESEGSQYITSGGGGAFVHGTLELKPEIKAEWLTLPREDLKLKACYPNKEASAALLEGNWHFGRLNRGLTLALSSFYVASTFVLTSAWRWDVSLGIFGVLLATLWGYSRHQEGNWTKPAVPVFVHALAHFLVIVAFAWVMLRLAEALTPNVHWHWLAWLGVLAVPILAVGPWIAGKIYGLSLMWSCRYFDISHNDAFSALRLDSHRHFLRIRVKGDELTVFPIKLDEVPSRDAWRENPSRTANPEAPVFVPDPPLAPTLIEDPIYVQVKGAASTDQVKTPGELPSDDAAG